MLPQRGPGHWAEPRKIWILEYFGTSEITPERSCYDFTLSSAAVCSITRRLQRYTRSPQFKGRIPETSGQTRRVGDTNHNVFATATCPSVRLSVCLSVCLSGRPSVTRRYCI